MSFKNRARRRALLAQMGQRKVASLWDGLIKGADDQLNPLRTVGGPGGVGDKMLIKNQLASRWVTDPTKMQTALKRPGRVIDRDMHKTERWSQEMLDNINSELDITDPKDVKFQTSLKEVKSVGRKTFPLGKLANIEVEDWYFYD